MSKNTGRVLWDNTGHYEVDTGQGEAILCRAATKTRNKGFRVKPGDFVTFEENPDGTGFITEIAERKNDFIRPSIANIDVLVIAVPATVPGITYYNIDKQTALAALNGVQAVIVITKCDDTVNFGDEYEAKRKKLKEIYTLASYPVFETSAKTGEGTKELREYLKGKVCAFSGASGVGKSGLINALYPNLSLKVGDISDKISRGKNTTRLTQLFLTDENTYVADTPGFTMLDMVKYDIIPFEKVYDVFPEMKEYTENCRYRKCTHTAEEGCRLRAAVAEGRVPAERYDSFLRLYRELKSKKQYKKV